MSAEDAAWKNYNEEQEMLRAERERKSLVYCNVVPRPHPVAVIQGRCVSCGQPVRSVT